MANEILYIGLIDTKGEAQKAVPDVLLGRLLDDYKRLKKLEAPLGPGRGDGKLGEIVFSINSNFEKAKTLNYFEALFLFIGFGSFVAPATNESGILQSGLRNFTELNTLTPAQKSFIIKNTIGKRYPDNTPEISSDNANNFTDRFGTAADGITWPILNSNPGAFWTSNASEIKSLKPLLSYEFIYLRTLAKFFAEDEKFGDFEKIWEFFIGGREGAWYTANNGPQVFVEPVYKSEGVIKSFRNHNTSYNYDYILKHKFDPNKFKLFKEINAKLFFTESQVENFRSITEGGDTVEITKEQRKGIVTAGKDDPYYNIFKPFLEQHPKSKIFQALSEIIDASGIDGPPEDIKVTTDQAAALGKLSVTEEDLEKLFADENQDFNDKLSQCILLTALSKIAKHSVKLRATENATLKSQKKASYPYGGRIYCVDTEKPNTLINILSSAQGISRYIKTVQALDFTSVGKGKPSLSYSLVLSKIVEKDGKSYELPFLFEDSKDEKGKKPIMKDLLLKNYQAANAETKKTMEMKTFNISAGKNKTGLNNKINLKNFKIGIKGETVATVKSNVDVTIDFSFPSLDIILAQFEANTKYDDYQETTGGTKGKYTYSLSELVSHSIGQKFDGTQASRALNTSYLPKKNRLVLKIVPTIANDKIFGTLPKVEKDLLETYIENSTFILDLTLVNYTAKRTVGKGNDTLSITYKGFTKSFLNEPFCDVLTSNKTKLALLEKEQAVIEELDTKSKFCDIKEVRKKIQEHYLDMKTTRDDAKAFDGSVSLIQGLIVRNRLFRVDFGGDVMGALRGNVDKDTKKIIRPSEVAKLLADQGLTPISVSDWDQSGSETLDRADNIKFFYFGDLIDVLLDVVYGEQKTRDVPKDGEETTKYRARDQLRKDTGVVVPAKGEGPVSEIRQKFANFPLKVILPVFQPIVLKGDDFTGASSEDEKISVADIPISIPFFQHWWEEEISKRKSKMYPLGAIINRLLNALVNNVLSDSCYSIGTIEKKYFSIKTDFGIPTNTSGGFSQTNFNNNYTQFDALWHSQKSGNFIKINNKLAPLLKKSNTVERNKHINYLVVYEQFNAFADMESIDPSKSNGTRPSLDALDIPQFKMKFDDKASGKTSDFVSNLEFSKADLPYGEEIRFYNDGLNELSTLSAVHDCTVTSYPLFSMFPGMISWIDPSFIDGSEIYGSIPWTMGFGGFHITYDVEHSGEVSSSKISLGAKTIMKTKFVDTGARNGGIQSYIKKCEDSVKELSQPASNGATENP